MPLALNSDLPTLPPLKLQAITSPPNQNRKWSVIAASFPTVLVWGLTFLGIPAAAQSNYISNIQGEAEVSHEGQAFEPAYVGDFLRTLDQLRVNSGSEVGIICHNESQERQFTAGTHTIGDHCEPEKASRCRGRRCPARDFNANLPYVISPRNTALLGLTRPIIRWNPVEGAQQYEVRVTGPGVEWSLQVSDTEAIYEGPALQQDTRYRITITADNGLTSSVDRPVGFTLLSVAEATRIQSEVEKIQALELDSDAEALGLALRYRGYEHIDPDLRSDALNQAALEVLQTRIDVGTENSQIYLLQGDIYLSVGLPLKAQERYEWALILATESEQLRRQANSLEGLAIVAQGESDLAGAIAYLEQALEIYEELGDGVQVEALQERIELLQFLL